MGVNSSAKKFPDKLIVDLRAAPVLMADIRWVIPLLFSVITFAYSMSNMASYVISDPDTLMHLASGSWMLEHHQVPATDPFSHNAAGLRWIAHEWLAQILMALSYDWGGFYGLRILVASLFSASIICQLIFLLNRVPAIYAIFFSALCFASLLGHHLARPHLFTWPVLIIWLSVLLNAVEKKQWRAPYILAPLMILWANLHGSFILGLMTIPFFALEAFVYATKGSKIKTLQSWAFFLMLSTAFSLVTPFGLDGIGFGVNMVSAQFTSMIQEWAPASGYNLLPIEYWLMLLLAMGLTGYLRLPLIRLILLLGFIHESLAHVRFISILGLVTPLLIAKPFGDLYYAKRGIKNNIGGLTLWVINRKRVLIVFLCACFSLLMLILTGKTYQNNFLKSSTAPESAINFIKQEGISGNVLNHYNMGGYLIFKKIPVFIDGRADLYGASKIQEYFSILNVEKTSNINKILNDHQISWTIFPPNEKIVFFLNGDAEWKKVFEDQDAVIHTRRSSAN